MSRSTIDRLHDIIHSAELAAQHVGYLGGEALSAAAGPRDAALFRLAVVCEAATRLPAEIQALAPDVEWQKVKGMRNIIVHDYWQIDMVIAAETIANDLESLKAAIRRLIVRVERSDA
jgi:uncharacterized protein with HEPN domain